MFIHHWPTPRGGAPQALLSTAKQLSTLQQALQVRTSRGFPRVASVSRGLGARHRGQPRIQRSAGFPPCQGGRLAARAGAGAGGRRGMVRSGSSVRLSSVLCVLLSTIVVVVVVCTTGIASTVAIVVAAAGKGVVASRACRRTPLWAAGAGAGAGAGRPAAADSLRCQALCRWPPGIWRCGTGPCCHGCVFEANRRASATASATVCVCIMWRTL